LQEIGHQNPRIEGDFDGFFFFFIIISLITLMNLDSEDSKKKTKEICRSFAASFPSMS
jgi:hypothetical protein